MAQGPYAGDLSAKEAWAVLERDPAAVLVDVRTDAEWSYVGVPDVSALGKRLLRVQWQTFPTGERNPAFADQLAQAGIPKDASVLFICRSGARSRDAAIAMTQRGYGRGSPPRRRRRLEGRRTALDAILGARAAQRPTSLARYSAIWRSGRSATRSHGMRMLEGGQLVNETASIRRRSAASATTTLQRCAYPKAIPM